MQHFFVSNLKWDEQTGCGTSELDSKQAHHLSCVLRAKVGDELTVAYAKEIFRAKISDITKDTVSLEVYKPALPNSELPLDLLLVQGLPKADKLEHIIMKACELGVSEIWPCVCERSISRDKKEKLAKLSQRRNEIALAACKQSHRAKLVEVQPSANLFDVLNMIDADYILFAYEQSQTEQNLANWFSEHYAELSAALKTNVANSKRKRIAILVGPEGGFSEKEVLQIQSLDKAFTINLGSRILRTETAPLAMLSYLMLELEQLTIKVTEYQFV